MGTKEFELEEILLSIDRLCASLDETEPGGGMETEPETSGYSPEELEQMGFCEAQIEEIEAGQSQNLPVRYYAKTEYNWKQMQEIRLGLQNNLDIGKYANALFSAEQMKEIRMGLMDGMDVSSYAKLVRSPKDMETARKEMLRTAYLSSPQGRAKELVDEGSGIRIRLSDDWMQAFITLPENRTFGAAELERILKRNDVNSGILREQLRKAADGVFGAREILAAEGTPAKRGADGRYEYFFDALPAEKPQVNANGSVDYTKVIVAERKQAGEVLAKYYPAQAGTDGQTVTGIAVCGSPGAERAALHGEGIERDEEENLYKAALSGYVVLDEDAGSLNVWDVYVVDGDVNRYNRTISYNGIIHIKGAVSDMARIEAAGNVVVDGYVEGAYIKAGENIILRSGMNGCGKGVLEAGGRVTGRFFEAASIYAGGNVEGNYFLNCNVVTDGSLIAKDRRSKILGGSVRAGYSVETHSVLGSGKLLTSIDVGNPVWIEKKLRETEERLQKSEDDLRQLTTGKDKLIRMFDETSERQDSLLHKVCDAIQIKEEEVQKLRGEIRHSEQIRARAKKAYITVLDRVQAGVLLTVGGRVKRVENDLDGAITFRREGA